MAKPGLPVEDAEVLVIVTAADAELALILLLPDLVAAPPAEDLLWMVTLYMESDVDLPLPL